MTFDFIFTFFVSLALLAFFVKLAPHLGFVDVPNFRSSHTHVTPNCCGIAFVVTIVIMSLFSDLRIYQNFNNTIFATILVFLVGVYDDLKSIRPRNKLYVITIAAILSTNDGLIITSIGSYFGYTLPYMWLFIPFTIFTVVGFTNSLNLIDGLDGLAGTISLILLGSLCFIGYQNNDILLVKVTTLVIPVLLAFLIFNWNPAKAFMGDSGSLTLGFLISILSIQALNYVNPIVILYLLALPIIDTLVVMARRIKTARPVFSPDKYHMHHILLNVLNGNVKKTVIIMAIVQLTYTILGITVIISLPHEIALAFFLLNIIIWYCVLTQQCANQPVLIKEVVSENTPRRNQNTPSIHQKEM